MVVSRVTSGPKNHFFGFHDLVQTNARGDLTLALEVEDITRPPMPGETCVSGVVVEGQFMPIHKTQTWNYPQGARQQWLGDSDLFTCNDRSPVGELISKIGDGRTLRIVDTLPFPVHCIVGNKAFWIDYDRLHAVGGYGYVPLRREGYSRIADVPRDDGLWIGDMRTGKRDLLAAIETIAECGEKSIRRTNFPHYVTHPMPNPSGTRIALLHQYRVPDGGDISRIVTIGVDGGAMRCLAKGLVSHFTWIDDETIFAWGGDERAICSFRESMIWRLPGAWTAARFAKTIVKKIRAMGKEKNLPDRKSVQTRSFMMLKDCDGTSIKKSGIGILTEDGHPMARPGRLSEVVCDTYPDATGFRRLFLYDTVNEKRVDIGCFRKIDQMPDINKFDWEATQSGVDSRIARAFKRSEYMFTRSGLHCDLHPRWSYDGKRIFFDSIHEGTRQIYSVEVVEND